ncbi:hypothetical protein BD770DRAFT_414899 [Pilaira anomala]|nr:hypothetical protein BD770DRAFT_414899 [Pilaira anomala]
MTIKKKISDIVVPGFESSQLIADLNKAFEGFFPEEEKQKLIKQVNGVFQFVIKNNEGKRKKYFTVDCKKEGTVVRRDADFIELAVSGKLNGQKAYMSGKLKVKGQNYVGYV